MLNRTSNLDMHSADRAVEALSTDTAYWSFGCLQRLCEAGKLGEAISAIKKMQQHGISISNKVFFYILRECTLNCSMSAGGDVFNLIVRHGLESNAYLGSQLIEFYAAFRSLPEANEVFERLHEPNIFCWSAVVLANVKLGNVEYAMALCDRMILSTLQADGHLFVAIIKACTDAGAITQGKAVHVRIESAKNLSQDICLGNALVNMYSKFGYLGDAYLIFDSLLQRDLVAWTAMITGHTQLGEGHEAMRLVFRLFTEGIEPDDVTSACIFKACASYGAEDCGDLIYCHILENSQELGSFAGSSIIHLYFKCGRLDDARKVFDGLSGRCTSAVWNTMIAGYMTHGHVDNAVCLLQCMRMKGLDPDKITYVNLLSAELPKVSSQDIRQITEHIAEKGFDADAAVGNALVHVHSNQGWLEDASKFFANVLKKDLISWSTMVGCYARHGYTHQALSSLQEMHQDGLQPNVVTFLSGLKACTKVVAFNQGKLVHFMAVENNCELNIFVGTTLIDLYSKCKSLQDSHHIFNNMPHRDSVTWNTLGQSYAQSNRLSEALELLYGMQLEGLKATHATFESLLKACCSLSFLACSGQALHLMHAKSTLLCLHMYNCMLDFFGRRGHLQKSIDLFYSVPYSSINIGSRSLLTHFRTYKNIKLGRLCFL